MDFAKAELYMLLNLIADDRRLWLVGADLSEANLTSANLSVANLISAELRNANLTSADLRNANLTSADLRYAKFNTDTKWPEGFDFLAAGAELIEEIDEDEDRTGGGAI